jgi:hypothetical protein
LPCWTRSWRKHLYRQTSTCHYIPSDADLQTTLNLLLTCKPVHEEIAAIVYSENKFVSIPKNPTDIGVLRKFSPRAISHLSDLAVHLNTTSCARYPHFEPCCRDSLQDTSRLEYHDESVKQVDADWRAFFSEWDRTMKHFLAYVTPDQLKLSLVCDVEDLTEIPVFKAWPVKRRS